MPSTCQSPLQWSSPRKEIAIFSEGKTKSVNQAVRGGAMEGVEEGHEMRPGQTPSVADLTTMEVSASRQGLSVPVARCC